MANTQKGNETKNKIINCARSLFYEKGYEATSMRQLSELAGVNIGLMNYYFESKAGIGLLIYSSIRENFEALLGTFEPGLNSEESFVISSAIELYLALNCKPFCDFYITISGEDEFKKNIGSAIMSIVDSHKDSYKNPDEAILNCIGTMATKPALIRYASSKVIDLDHKTIIEYYMKLQLTMLAENPQTSQKLIDILYKYNYNLAPGFTPVMTPVIV